MLRRFFNKRRINKGTEIEDSVMTATQKEEAVIEDPSKRKELYFFWCVIIITIAILAGRVFYLVFFRGDYYSEISRGNRIKSVVIKAPRGIILDKKGKILARNMPSIDVVAIPSDLPKDEKKKEDMAKELAEILDMNFGNVEIILDSQDIKSSSPVLLKGNISKEQTLIIAEKKNIFPGIELEKTAIRLYDNGPIFSSFMGYDGKITREELNKNPGYAMTDYIGKTGLEKSYEKEIKGIHGANQVETDSMGKIKRTIGVINPVAGNDLVLNIDEGLQKKIYDSLNAILDEAETKTAAAVAINPQNGGVLAMVSLPSYDNNLFAKGITNDEFQSIINNKSLPLLNRVISGEYPPGSTLKPAVALAALTEGVISQDTTVNDSSGAIYVGSWRFGDWKTHGVVDVRKAIAESCDVFFYAVGGGYGNISGLGMSKMKKYENMFGFGNPTGIDLAGESSGFIPDEEWKLNKLGEKWYIGNSYHASIGQGYITATPIQLANYTASIANGGTLYSPKIVNRIRGNDGDEKLFNPEIIRNNFVDPEILKIIKESMRLTVTSGTAQMLNNLPIPIAGKTGTAEFGIEGKTHSWFISFAPYDNPEIAMVVLVEGGGEGHSTALPVTREVLKWYFEDNK